MADTALPVAAAEPVAKVDEPAAAASEPVAAKVEEPVAKVEEPAAAEPVEAPAAVEEAAATKPAAEVEAPAAAAAEPAAEAPVAKAEETAAEPATAAAAAPAAVFDLESGKAKQTKKQIEFYFSDSNFVRDEFLRTEAKKNPEGFVEIAVLLRFNRLKTITKDPAFVAAVMRTSSQCVVDEAGSAIRRSDPAPDAYAALPRSVFAEGFPEDATLEGLQVTFRAVGEVLFVKMRRDNKTKAFVGSVFVEMQTTELAEACVTQAAELRYAGAAPTRVCLMQGWLDELAAAKAKAAATRAEARPKAAPRAERSPARKRELVPGCVLALTGVAAECDREAIRAAVSDEVAETIAFIDYQRGDSEGWVRFKDAESAKLGAAALEGKELGGVKPEKLALLEGEVEAAFWAKMWAKQDEKRKSGGGGRGGKRKFGGGGRGRGRGGYGNKRGRRR